MTIADKLISINNTKGAIKNAIEAKGVTVGSVPFADYASKILEIEGGGSPEPKGWTRPSDWIPIPNYSVEDDDVVFIIVALFPNVPNRIALRFNGAVNINWGDGTSELLAANTNYYKDYNYEDSLFDNTQTSQGFKQVLVTINPTNTSTTMRLNVPPFGADTPTSNYTRSNWLEIVWNSTITVGANDSIGASSGSTTNPAQANQFTQSFVCTKGVPIRAAFCRNLRKYKCTSESRFSITFTNTFFLSNTTSLEEVEVKINISNSNPGPLLSGCVNLRKVSLDIDGINFSADSWFSGCNSLTSISNFTMSQSITSMTSMFNGCNSLTSVPLFDTSNVINMSNMFNGCRSLNTVPLFDTSNVTSMQGMFNGCNSLTSVPLFDTSNVTSMQGMFNGCNSLTSVPLFDTSKVTTMNTMFLSCNSLERVPAFNTQNVTNFVQFVGGEAGSTFVASQNTYNLKQISMGPINAAIQINRSPQLSRDAIVAVFNNLTDRSGLSSLTININNLNLGGYGVAQLTQEDRNIALNKNWTIVG